MIKLTKNNKPEILLKNAEKWTEDILSKLQNAEKLSNTDNARYRHPEIKSALISETNGKCAYCESKLLHIHHGDIEHIIPKSLEPKKRYEWENLTLACEICNQNKSNRDPKTTLIIDPYITDPKNHLHFSGPMIFPLGTNNGKNTSTILDLNRVALLERRKEKLANVLATFDTILNENLPIQTRKIIYYDFLEHDASSKSEYTAMVQCVVKSMQDRLPPEIKEENVA
ncbi:HNH endonuclease [Aeromonas veronii]|uniref:HNH endonuclease n=1 Tax=Aeromonas veronii TaxID=654 RepID=UPI00214D6BD3|nr:HNH endonuclease [Aeromonas veronii]MCR3969326.1 HNH endonuclease [Aeromonas veronii]MCR3981805.1 HNH endonuclease [Aeromonas veronii]